MQYGITVWYNVTLERCLLKCCQVFDLRQGFGKGSCKLTSILPVLEATNKKKQKADVIKKPPVLFTESQNYRAGRDLGGLQGGNLAR